MKTLGTMGAVAALLFLAAPAGAILVPFEVVEDNSPDVDTLVLQFEAEILDAGGGNISVTLYNDGPSFMGTPLNGRIAEAYFDDDADLLDDLLSVPANWGEGASPPNLPGGNNVSFDADFAAEADNPAPMNGIDVGESGTFLFSLEGGVSFSDIEEALENGELRIGLHVTGTGSNEDFSDSFVSGPPDLPVVPEPATTILLGIGAVGLAIRARQHRKV